MMATTIIISTSVKPAVLFVLICMTNVSVVFFQTRGVNDAKGGLLLLFNLFTNCLLQPRLSNIKQNASVNFRKSTKKCVERIGARVRSSAPGRGRGEFVMARRGAIQRERK